MSVPAAITTLLTDASLDVAIISGIVLSILVGMQAFKYMRRAIVGGPGSWKPENTSSYVKEPGVWVNPNATVPMTQAETIKETWKAQEMSSMQQEKPVWVNPMYNPNYQFSDEDKESESKKDARGKI